ncbi:MAG: YhbY family RNA-binding protein [Polynucleobacter sp.]|nr:YhbY family RNA-binding protein [Polynucleobacter sp.]
MTKLTITPAQRKSLKAKAHDLNPVVMIGNAGLSPSVIKEAQLALKSHELIKIRVLGDDRELRAEMYDKLCDALHAAPVQHIGKLLVVWRPKPTAAEDEAFARSAKKTKKKIQAPRTALKAVRKTAAKKSVAPKAVGKGSKAPVRESKIGWTSAGYTSRKLSAPAPNPKRRKVRQSSIKKKLLG